MPVQLTGWLLTFLLHITTKTFLTMGKMRSKVLPALNNSKVFLIVKSATNRQIKCSPEDELVKYYK
jgi:hypothetical protein